MSETYGQLVLLDGEDKDSDLIFLTKAGISIGRDPQCDLKFKRTQKEVSRRHAKVYTAANGSVFVESLGRQPVLVNDSLASVPVELISGDILGIQLEGRCKRMRFESCDDTVTLHAFSNKADAYPAKEPLSEATNFLSPGRRSGRSGAKDAARMTPSKPVLAATAGDNDAPGAGLPGISKIPKAPPPPAPPPPQKGLKGLGLKKGGGATGKNGPKSSALAKGKRESKGTPKKAAPGAATQSEGGKSGALIPSAADLQNILAGLRRVNRPQGMTSDVDPKLASPSGQGKSFDKAKRKSVRFQLPGSPAELTHESRERSVKKSDQLSLRSLEPSNPSETLQQQLHSNGSPARGGSEYETMSPEGVARDATCRLSDLKPPAAVKIDADSTLDFSMWAMGSSMEPATDSLTGLPADAEGPGMICSLSRDTLVDELDDLAEEGGDTEVLPLAACPSTLLDLEVTTEQPGLLAQHELNELGAAASTDSPGVRGLRGDPSSKQTRSTGKRRRSLLPAAATCRPVAPDVQNSDGRQSPGSSAERGLSQEGQQQRADSPLRSPSLAAGVETILPATIAAARDASMDAPDKQGPVSPTQQHLLTQGGQAQDCLEGPDHSIVKASNTSTDPNNLPRDQPEGIGGSTHHAAALERQLTKAKWHARVYYTKMKLTENNLRKTSRQNVILRHKLRQLEGKHDYSFQTSKKSPMPAGKGVGSSGVAASPGSDRAIILRGAKEGIPSVTQHSGHGIQFGWKSPQPADQEPEAAAGQQATPNISSPQVPPTADSAARPGRSTGQTAQADASPLMSPGSQQKQLPSGARRDSLLQSVLRGSMQTRSVPAAQSNQSSVSELGAGQSPAAQLPTESACSRDDTFSGSPQQEGVLEHSEHEEASPSRDTGCHSMSPAEDIEGDTADISSWAMGLKGAAVSLESVQGVYDNPAPAIPPATDQTLRITGPSEEGGVPESRRLATAPTQEPTQGLGRSLRVSPADSQAQQSLVGGALEPIAEEQEEGCSPTAERQAPSARDSLPASSPLEDPARIMEGLSGRVSEASPDSGQEGRESAGEGPHAGQAVAEVGDAGVQGDAEEKVQQSDPHSTKHESPEGYGNDSADAARSQLPEGLPKQSGMEESAEDDSCFVCQEADVGDVLLICESCERAAHKHCVGLRRIPKGDWFCQDCKGKDSKKGGKSENDAKGVRQEQSGPRQEASKPSQKRGQEAGATREGPRKRTRHQQASEAEAPTMLARSSQGKGAQPQAENRPKGRKRNENLGKEAQTETRVAPVGPPVRTTRSRAAADAAQQPVMTRRRGAA